MSSIAVTGAAGFIGSHVSRALISAGWRVRGIDAFTDTYDPEQKRANLRELVDPRFELVEADLGAADVDGLLDGVDAVVHLAAEPGVGASWGNGFTSYVERNVLAMQRVLEAASRARIDRFVYASSSSVYGSGVTAPIVEGAVPRPASPYGASKLMGELLLAAYVDQRALPGVSLRYFSVYGPRQRPDMAAHRFIEALLDRRPLTVYGDGTQQRDFTYVDDVTEATLAAVTADIRPGAVFNIAAGRPVPVGRLIALLAELVDGDPAVIARQPARPGDVDRTEGDTGAATRGLGWRPRTDLGTGLARQVAWHRDRRAGAAAGPAALVEAGRG
jgi:nucleoside-diphosphate-sugar epimerase